MWNAILQRFQGVSAALQAVELDLCNAVDLVRSLREYVAGLRDQFDNFETAAKNMSPTVSEEYRADTQRKRKRKSQADDSSEPECELSGRSRFRTSVFIRVIDRLVSELDRRYQSYNDVTTAAHVLEQKQEMLHLPKHRLINDVATRWNSSYEMVERYLEQQSAVYSALSALKNKDIANLTDQEVRVAENMIEIMKPLKTVTTILSTETAPSVSMILPLKTMILKSMEQNDEDTPTVRELKHAITENLQKRYSDAGLQDFLHKCTALDPRFKTLPHLDPVQVPVI
ncbi:hypothetical protein F7725_001555 [Dissostichus mawsoni]|uniref:Uncharacterized protein n=1 Tax=Dissostichus mawsoni TaxID=36200 RepID=A0A7J5Y009_DISMA|nr:hypothetical protein F7725_001555 [Dissostichus mawsoni]